MSLFVDTYLTMGKGIACLGGDTKHFMMFMECHKHLTRKGWMTFLPDFKNSLHKDMDNKDPCDIGDKLQLHKIAHSDCLVIICENSELDKDAKMQLDFARKNGIPTFFFQNCEFLGYTDKKIPQISRFEINAISEFYNFYK